MSTPEQKKLPPQYYYEEDAISFENILISLARQIKVIIITPTILCTLTIIYVLFFTQPVYKSTAKIMSSSSGAGGISQAAGLAAEFGINISPGQSEPNWVYPEIIKSRTLARSMLKRKFDTNKFGMQKSLLQILTYGNEPPSIGLDTLEIMAVDNFLGMIDVYEDLSTSILTLSIYASEALLAAEINQALIEELDSHQRQYNKTKTSDTKQFIEERIIEIEKELNIAEEALRDFTTRNRRIENSALLLLEQQRLAREVTVLTGVFTTLKQQLETTKIEQVKESDYVVILDSPETPLVKSKPNNKLMVITSGIMGIMLGIIIGFIREKLNNNDLIVKINNLNSIVIKNLRELFYIR